jgi:hypothetical protein
LQKIEIFYIFVKDIQTKLYSEKDTIFHIFHILN